MADFTTVKWVESMLSSRIVRLRLHGVFLDVMTTKGCPQGGVISPLLWTLVIDGLLYKMDELRIDTQGYADDLVIMNRGDSQSTISYLIQKALNIISKWCQENELAVNADKTVLVPFTRKRKLEGLISPRLNNRSLSSRYRFPTSQVDGIVQKAKFALSSCSRLVGQKWGLKPNMALWLYTAIVRPLISYGSVVWCRKIAQKTVIAKLRSLQRTACAITTGDMTSTPGAALNALLNLPPLNLYLQKEARASMHRVMTHMRTNWLSNSLRLFEQFVLRSLVLDMVSDAMLPKFDFISNFSIEFPTREDWLNNRITWKKGSLKWYTDGSKSGSDVGCGIFGECPKFGKSVNLGNLASVFQSEVYAIIEFADTILNKGYVGKCIYIHTDSQAALSAIDSNRSVSKLVDNCRTILNTLGRMNRVTLRWVPGHAGIEGNEYADELARIGAKSTQFGPEPFCGVPRSLFGTISSW
ncbi:uncharacterized protein LOC126979109 [Leptidea sinapis]|uniref:uncharacterized protein LOC126979109 n=1 Tax=Leptidea sinapis TaxID=189913 RepID=UPI0021C4057A|nr:uncharacterized protein LOC126979109 [Leptidea sinapis]